MEGVVNAAQKLSMALESYNIKQPAALSAEHVPTVCADMRQLLLGAVANLLLIQDSNSSNPNSNMGVEESVYLAKLAEQAERYEGRLHPLTAMYSTNPLL